MLVSDIFYELWNYDFFLTLVLTCTPIVHQLSPIRKQKEENGIVEQL